MLQQPLYSLFIRMIPESFLVLLSVCLLTNSRVNYKNIVIASVISGVCVYLTRLMPIHFGVHTILSVMITILLSNKFSNIKMQKAIIGSLTSVILLFISDLIIFTFYQNVLNLASEVLIGNSVLAILATLPSLFILFSMVKVIVYMKERSEK